MTASHIADQLGVANVTINLRASELLDLGQFGAQEKQYPMKKLEFMTMGQSLEEMRNQREEYKSEEYFPKSVDITKSAEYYTEIMNAYPEDSEAGFRRAINLDEHIRQRVEENSL
jgi:hypothetical protein